MGFSDVIKSCDRLFLDFIPKSTCILFSRLQNNVRVPRYPASNLKVAAMVLISLTFIPACSSDNKQKPISNSKLELNTPFDKESLPQNVADHTKTAVDPWLVDVTQQSGIDFTYKIHIETAGPLIAAVGSGIAIFDADGDSDLDIYLAQASDTLPKGTPSKAGMNRFFEQVAPMKFIDSTEGSGLADEGFTMGVASGDYNNDGLPDIYVCNNGQDHLYKNLGGGQFTNVTIEAGIDIQGTSVSAGWLDYDLDGDLDLYVTQYVEYDITTQCTDAAGRKEFCGPKAFPPSKDVLLKNTGDGKFIDVSTESGINKIAAASLGIVFLDQNADGLMDIYVANDAYANNLYVNQGDGKFVDLAPILGAALNMNGQKEAGMGVIAADFDNDSFLDLFVTHLVMESNTFYKNLGPNIGFNDTTGQSGLATSSMPFTGFGVSAMDLELDGDLDLFIANGKVTRGDSIFKCNTPPPLTEYSEPNHIYLNDGSGKFKIDNNPLCEFSKDVRTSRSIVHADLDRDGDLDLIVSNVQEPTQIFRNDAPRSGQWLVVDLLGIKGGPVTEGATVIAQDGEELMTRTFTTCKGYASAFPAEVHFGAVNPGNNIEVVWPGGIRENFNIEKWNQRVQLTYGEGETK